MNAQDLKNSILQLAIKGKLVDQRKEEGTAKELLEQIEAEKERLIKEGKIKKQKKLPEIKADEIPFDIPESWEWAKLEKLANITGGYAFKSTNYTEQGVRVIRISDFNERGFVDNKIVRHPYDDSLEMFLLEKNNILLCMTGGTVGKSLFVKEVNEPMMTNQRVATIKISHNVLPEYINYTVLSSVIQSIIRTSKNSTNDNISMNTIKGFPIPLPPLEEQKRIVAKIEELMPYLDKYYAAYTEVYELNKKFPEDMQKSILQYAIQGKLVDQREEEGIAEELYQQIQEEKKRLIKEGKVRKSKALPEINEEDIPFDIPKNWKWVRLGDLVSFYGGYAYKSSTYVNESNNMIIRLGNVKNDNLLLDVNPVFIPQDIADATSKYKILPEDILFTMTGTKNKRDYFYTALTDEEDLKRFELFLNQRVGCLRNECKIVNMRWLSLALKSECILSQIFSFETGTANQGNIGSDNTLSLMIPLPPLKEQKRIVDKIEELLPYAKQLVKQ